MATCDELASQLSDLQSQLADLQYQRTHPNEACADQGLTGADCELYLKGLGNQIRAVQTQIAGVQQQQQDQQCIVLGPIYEIIELGTLGGKTSYANDINSMGQVVGASETADGSSHAFLWNAGAGMQDLGTLGGRNSEALAINENGQIVGWTETADGEQRAFLWSASTGMLDLLGTSGGQRNWANDINNLGQVVGTVFYDSIPRAFLWSASTGVQDLGNLGSNLGVAASEALAINENGQIVGKSWLVIVGAWSGYHAFLWSASTGMQDLGTLSGQTRESWANNINNLGQVVGRSETADGSSHAFLWNAGAGMQDLGTLGGRNSEALAINENGQIVGWTDTHSTLYAVFLLGISTGMQDLNSLLPANSYWQLSDISRRIGINQSGGIVSGHWNSLLLNTRAWLFRKHQN